MVVLQDILFCCLHSNALFAMSASYVISSIILVSLRFQTLLSIWPPPGQRSYTELSQVMSTELCHCHWHIVAVSGPSFIPSFSSIMIHNRVPTL